MSNSKTRNDDQPKNHLKEIIIMKLIKLVGKDLCDKITEIREDSDNYEEIVLLSKDIVNWNKSLTEKLGPALITKEEYEIVESSEDVKSSKINTALELANSYGGIIQGQTLYHSVYDSTVILILIWPWQDGEHVTLKKAIL